MGAKQKKTAIPGRFKRFVMFFRRNTYCRFGTHWNMKYDSGLNNDIGNPGTCLDCNYRTEGIVWPRHDNSHLINLLQRCRKTRETESEKLKVRFSDPFLD